MTFHTCAGNERRSAHGRYLIDAGADVNVLLDEGYSLLDIAYETQEKLEAMISQQEGTQVRSLGQSPLLSPTTDLFASIGREKVSLYKVVPSWLCRK